MSTVNLRTLVLNKNYMPLSVWPLSTEPAEKIIVDVLGGKAEVMYNYDRKVLTPSRDDLFWPSVVVNTTFTNPEREMRLRKFLLFYRDHCRCIFCGDNLTRNSMTTEHLVPKSKGGKHTWENVGAACKKCNHEKGAHLPIGKWKPLHRPFKPTFFQLFEHRKKFPIVVNDPRWAEFLPNWQGRIIVREPKNRIFEVAA